MRRIVLSLLATLIYAQVCYGAANSPRVVVNISGTFSSNPNDIVVNGHPVGQFPIPALLGGSFSGSVEYLLDAPGVLQGFKRFPFSATTINIFDDAGNSIHTITLPTGFYVSPLQVGFGQAVFYLGSSGNQVEGWLPRMPTDLRFRLSSDVFNVSADQPPSAADLNAASLYRAAIPSGPFIELDDAVNYFNGWDLPITSMSLFATEVPEPSTAGLLFMFIVTAVIPSRSIRRPNAR